MSFGDVIEEILVVFISRLKESLDASLVDSFISVGSGGYERVVVP